MKTAILRCFECRSPAREEFRYRCGRCGGLLEVVSDLETAREFALGGGRKESPISVWRYRHLLPVDEGTSIVTLGEGGTGLHRCSRLGEAVGVNRLHVKNEGENPTGSFKDRGMTVGVTRARESKAKAVICASTGNTSASLAAYSAKAGLRCIVVTPGMGIARGKLAQAIAHGAFVLRIRGNFDDAFGLVLRLLEERQDTVLMNSVNPFRLEGQKTAAYEVCEQLGRVPDKVLLPVGNAGNISALWKGFKEFYELGLTDRLPAMIGVQAEGSAPLADAVMKERDELEPVEHPQTLASAIRIGRPANWRKALKAVRESGGTIISVSDEEILDAQKKLARLEGLFVEPASAAPVAGLKRLAGEGIIGRDEEVVCIATGHGLKDPGIVIERYEKPEEVDADYESLKEALTGKASARWLSGASGPAAVSPRTKV